MTSHQLIYYLNYTHCYWYYPRNADDLDRRHNADHAARGVPRPAHPRPRSVPARVGRARPLRPPLVRRLRQSSRHVRRGGADRRAGRGLPRLRPRRKARADGAASRQRHWAAREPIRRRRRAPSVRPPARRGRSARGTRRPAPRDRGLPPSGARPLGDTLRFPNADTYMRGVEKCKEHIRRGDAFQIVLSQRAEKRTDIGAVELYRALRRVNPSPYLFLLELDGIALVGSSPETLVKREEQRASVNPIAGSTSPGTGDAERLLASAKDRAEHIMLVDLGRNDLSRVCAPGHGQGGALPRGGAVLARHASRLRSRRRPAAGCVVVRSAARDVPGRHRVRRTESARHADHLRARGLPPRPIRRCRPLFPARGTVGRVHRDPHGRPARGPRAAPGRRRDRRRERPARGARGVPA